MIAINGDHSCESVEIMPTTCAAICVVDDDPLVRKTIEAILLEEGNTVEGHPSGASFLDAVKAGGRYDCVLLDVNMPDMSGLDVLQHLGNGKGLPIVMISGQGDISTAVEAMRKGATDFIEKPFTPEQLLAAVSLATALPRASTPPTELAGLSARELEVLELLANGDANKVIAYKLGISQRTVEVHRAKIMERMGVKTFAELVRKAIASGL